MRLIWSPDAERDLLEIWKYLAREASAGKADEQIGKIERASQVILEWPHSGRQRDELLIGMRCVQAWPYVLFYRVVEAEIQIVRVLHGRRDLEAIFSNQS